MMFSHISFKIASIRVSIQKTKRMISIPNVKGTRGQIEKEEQELQPDQQGKKKNYCEACEM